jgi:hypothetical protein
MATYQSIRDICKVTKWTALATAITRDMYNQLDESEREAFYTRSGCLVGPIIIDQQDETRVTVTVPRGTLTFSRTTNAYYPDDRIMDNYRLRDVTHYTGRTIPFRAR